MRLSLQGTVGGGQTTPSLPPPPAPHCNPGRPATPFPLPGPTRRPVQLSGPPHPLLEHPGPCVSAPVALPLGVLPICTDGCKTRLMHQFVPSGGCSRRFKGSGLPFDGSAVPEPTCWGCDTGLFSWKVTHTSPIPLPVIAWLPDYPPPPRGWDRPKSTDSASFVAKAPESLGVLSNISYFELGIRQK